MPAWDAVALSGAPRPVAAMQPPASVWRVPGQRLGLTPGEVHVWRAALDRDPADIQDAEGALAPDEQARAKRFVFERDRGRFAVGRAVLRAILARYLAVPPDRVGLCYGPRGKPALAPSHAVAGLRFNLAHSDGLALYALALGREIGVDLERLRPEIATESVAENFFSPAEVTILQGLGVERRARAFFDCWTRKEAYIKARGDGLWLPLDGFEVSLAPGEPAALLATRDDPAEAARWALRELDAGPGYAAALAVEGPGCRLRCWQWPDGRFDSPSHP